MFLTNWDVKCVFCQNVTFVSSTLHSPHLVEAVRIARDRGLDLPIVWNCGGHERVEIVEEMEGTVVVMAQYRSHYQAESEAFYARFAGPSRGRSTSRWSSTPARSA